MPSRISSSSRSLLIWLAVALIGLLAALPLWHDGFLNKRIIGETPYLLMRVQQLVTSLHAGVFPVRWMPDGAYGLGYPFYNYYAALPFYLAAALRLVGFGTIVSIKLVQTLSFILGSLGVYAWSRRHFRHDSAAIAAAALFTFAPMHLINIYTRGDSLSEFWAMSMYPWLLWAIHRVITRPHPRTVAWLALFVAALMLSHNISALIFSPIAALYALWLVLPHWRVDSIWRWLGLAAGGLLGLALSAWFWLPALLDQPSLRMENMLVGFFDYHNSFLDQTPFQTGWLIDYETYPYRPGLWQVVIALAGLVAILLLLTVLRKRIHLHLPPMYRRVALWAVLALLISVGMTFSFSTWAYEHLPLLKYLQFPWRWLSVVSLIGAFVGAYLIDLIGARRLRVATLILVGLLTITSALPSLKLNFIPISEDQITSARLNEAEFFSGDIGTTVRTDYLPTAAYPRPLTGPAILNSYPLKTLAGTATGSLRQREPNWQTWQVIVTSDQAVIAIPILYWPGWNAYLEDNTRLTTSAVDGLGWIQVAVPTGDHTITFRLEETPQRWFLDAISALALLLWLALIARPLRRWLLIKRHQQITAIGLAGMLLLLILVHMIGTAPAPDGPSASQFLTVSYRHNYPGGIPFKDAERLLDYAYPTEIDAGTPLTVTLHWDQPTPAYIEIIPAPVNFWGYKAALAVAQGTDTITVPIPSEATPGLYFVHITAGSETYDLTPLRVRASTLHPDVLPASTRSADFSDILRLLNVTAASLDHGRVNIYMHWQVLKPITRNYGLSIRLRNPAGIQIATHDAAMGVYGTVPPAYWQSTSPITDWVSLPDLDGLPPGTGYQITITVYDNDRTIGSADIRDLDIATSPAQSTTDASQSFTGEVKTTAQSVEQGNPLILDCLWRGPIHSGWQVRWRLQPSESDTPWETLTPLAPGARLEWWRSDQRYHALLPLQIPLDLKPGIYTLHWDIVDAAGEMVVPGISGGSIEIKPTTRLFSAPPMANTTSVSFGQLIQLVGFSADQQSASLNLRLLWKAEARKDIDTDYTYFIHVQRTDAPTPAAQIDTMPHNNQYPTSKWLLGEYVLDEPSVSLAGLPTGNYDIWLGWYNPHDGTRLTVPDAPDGRYLLTRISIP